MPTAFLQQKNLYLCLNPSTEVHGKLIDRAYGPYSNLSIEPTELIPSGMIDKLTSGFSLWSEESMRRKKVPSGRAIKIIPLYYSD